ncbi:MAG: fructose-bisphosphatase class II family protein [Alphaproteobacteria bacterium]|nr:fructose-bisphosphatase class II family protein [Alphaproteobacteria bacterium]
MTHLPFSNDLPPLLSGFGLRAVTEAAARAAFDWISRGDRVQGDAAARVAMLAQLARQPIDGTIIVGDIAQDQTNGPFPIGNNEEPGIFPQFDIAVDPTEGTSYLQQGLTNAMAVIALVPRGTMFDPGSAFHMEKFAGPPVLKGKIDPTAPVAAKLEAMSRLLDKPIAEMTIYVLEKPRHRELVEQIHLAGARVALYPAGDVAGGIMAAIPDSGIDAMMGTGGTPEGILCACAIRAMGGEFMGRLAPQLATEKLAVERSGTDTTRWLMTEELVKSDRVFFCATGISTGLMLTGVERTKDYETTQTLMVSGPLGERQILTTHHRRNAG